MRSIVNVPIIVALVGVGLAPVGGVDMARAQCQANEFAELLADDGAAGDWFGRSVCISGNVAVIGASFDDDACACACQPCDPNCNPGCNSGAAYVYRYDPNNAAWSQEAMLTTSDAEAGDEFGQSVSCTDDVVVVGSPQDDDQGNDSGSAYVYRYDPQTEMWNVEAKITSLDTKVGDHFGAFVSISGDALVVGAPLNDHAEDSSGSAYVFERNQDGSDNWGRVVNLTPLDPIQNAFFGGSVSIDGDIAVSSSIV